MNIDRNRSLVEWLVQHSDEALQDVEACMPQFDNHLTGWYFEPLAEHDEIVSHDHPVLAKISRTAADRFPDSLVDVIGGPCGVEIYDKVAPTREWLRVRAQEMAAFADDVELVLCGWTYEPGGITFGRHNISCPPSDRRNASGW